jgi:hypothetical protein
MRLHQMLYKEYNGLYLLLPDNLLVLVMQNPMNLLMSRLFGDAEIPFAYDNICR